MTTIQRIETLRRGQILAVQVHTDDGLVGLGQTAPYQVELTEHVLHTMVAPCFLGRDPWDVEALVELCLRQHYKFLGGFLQRAVGGVDTALWDVLGKATEKPVHQLIGGTYRTRVPMYASSMLRSVTPEEEADRLEQQIEQYGFTAAKIRVGAEMARDRDQWPGRTEAIIPHLRARLGDEIGLSADANGGFTAGRAIRIGRMLEDHGYFHFEEPCPYPQIEQTGAVARALDIPVSGGEQDTSLDQIHRIITGGHVDIIQPDIGYLGGLSRARQVAIMADAAGIPCTPHCANHSLLQVFTLHLAAAMPACAHPQEWSAESPEWVHSVYAPALQVTDGMVTVPTSPGWGVELTEEFLATAGRRASTRE